MSRNEDALNDLRRQIDEIDDGIHDLLMRRTEVAQRIGALKAGDATFLRPGREAMVLRRLLARHRGALPKALIVRIWREIFAAVTALQGSFAVAVYAPEGSFGYRNLARDQYGWRTPITAYRSAAQVLEAVRGVEGVQEVRSIRLRPSGPKVFVDTTVGIRRTTPFERAHAIMDDVERAIHASHTDVDVVVHAEPLESDDETIVDKVRMIALQKGMRAPHNLEVHHTGGRYFIDFDLEYRRGKSFVEAHEVAAEIEREIHESLGSVEKVTIHLEEYQPEEVELTDVGHAEATLRESIRARVLLDERVLGCSDVTLLKLDGAYNASVTCQVEESTSLDEVHTIVAETENALYREFGQLRRVTIRAEPA